MSEQLDLTSYIKLVRHPPERQAEGAETVLYRAFTTSFDPSICSQIRLRELNVAWDLQSAISPSAWRSHGSRRLPEPRLLAVRPSGVGLHRVLPILEVGSRVASRVAGSRRAVGQPLGRCKDPTIFVKSRASTGLSFQPARSCLRW